MRSLTDSISLDLHGQKCCVTRELHREAIRCELQDKGCLRFRVLGLREWIFHMEDPRHA